MVAARVGNRAGKVNWGCLLTLVVLAAAVYYGIDAGFRYARYFQLKDEMQTVANFATALDDEAIVRRLRAKVDELGLPADARRFRVRRRSRPREIIITTSWPDTVRLPFYNLPVTHRPEVRGQL